MCIEVRNTENVRWKDICIEIEKIKCPVDDLENMNAIAIFLTKAKRAKILKKMTAEDEGIFSLVKECLSKKATSLGVCLTPKLTYKDGLNVEISFGKETNN